MEDVDIRDYQNDVMSIKDLARLMIEILFCMGIDLVLFLIYYAYHVILSDPQNDDGENP